MILIVIIWILPKKEKQKGDFLEREGSEGVGRASENNEEWT